MGIRFPSEYDSHLDENLIIRWELNSHQNFLSYFDNVRKCIELYRIHIKISMTYRIVVRNSQNQPKVLIFKFLNVFLTSKKFANTKLIILEHTYFIKINKLIVRERATISNAIERKKTRKKW